MLPLPSRELLQRKRMVAKILYITEKSRRKMQNRTHNSKDVGSNPVSSAQQSSDESFGSSLLCFLYRPFFLRHHPPFSSKLRKKLRAKHDYVHRNNK